MKLTKKQKQQIALDLYGNIRRIGEVARILRQRRPDCTSQHSFKVARRFVAIYGNGINK